jgi:tRNA pseudouridine38-40 synthase
MYTNKTDIIYNIKLMISFNGSDFCGWQIQNNTNDNKKMSIQKVIERILFEIYKNEKIKLIGSSRTDTNVNAKRFVANYWTTSFISTQNLKKAINSKIFRITKKIKILSVEYVEKLKDNNIIQNINKKTFFHSRYSAKGKLYIYKIFNGKADEKSVFDEFSYPIGKTLAEHEILYLKKFVKIFVGQHNFEAFSTSQKHKEKDKNNICNIQYISLKKFGNLDNKNIYILIKSDRFLRKMIRFIVGAIIEFALKKLTIDDIIENLNTGIKKHKIKVVPGNGLFLQRVYY